MAIRPGWVFSAPCCCACLSLAAPLPAFNLAGFGSSSDWLSPRFTFCCTIIARQHRDYYVTIDRVETQWGILGRSSKEALIKDISLIDVHQKGIIGWLGIGTVDFGTSGTEGIEVQFKNVRRPHRIKDLVRQLQQRAK